jgi:hypothetical protein
MVITRSRAPIRAGSPHLIRPVLSNRQIAAKETPMRKLWLALFAAVALLIGGVGTASAQMHGGGGGSHGGGGGWHGGHFHDGRFHHFHTNFGVFIGAPAFWWGAPYYPYYYPYSYYDGYSYPGPVYGDPGPTTYIQQDSGTAGQSSGGGYWYYCTDPAGYYPQVQNCAKGWLKVVPDGSPTPPSR